MRGHSRVTPTIKSAGTELDIYLVEERLCMCEFSVWPVNATQRPSPVLEPSRALKQESTVHIKPFIKSILKSLVILAIWLALRGAIYTRIVPFFVLNRIFFLANDNGTVKQNNQSDFKVSLTQPIKFQENKRQKATVFRILQLHQNFVVVFSQFQNRQI